MPNFAAINYHKNSGYVAIMSVLIVAAVVLGIAVSAPLLGIGEGQASLAQSNGEDSLAFVEGCLEDALLKLRASSSYSSGTITRPEGTCTITVAGTNPNFTVTATSTSITYRRTVQAVVTRGSSLTITSWKEQ